jgi:hypothetical protein
VVSAALLDIQDIQAPLGLWDFLDIQDIQATARQYENISRMA